LLRLERLKFWSPPPKICPRAGMLELWWFVGSKMNKACHDQSPTRQLVKVRQKLSRRHYKKIECFRTINIIIWTLSYFRGLFGQLYPDLFDKLEQEENWTCETLVKEKKGDKSEQQECFHTINIIIWKSNAFVPST
jgi:hypothetical protein